MEENKEKTVKKRQECDPAYQWHIQDLYTSDEAWEKDYESLTSEIQSLAAYEGRLKEGSEVFVEYMRKKEALMKKFEAIYVYANQRYHEDTGNSFYQGLAGKAQTLSIQLDSAVVFEEPELLAIGKKTIDSWFTQNMDMQLYKRNCSASRSMFFLKKRKRFLLMCPICLPMYPIFFLCLIMQISVFHLLREKKEKKFQ